MDIERANRVLGKAITGFQDEVIEDLAGVFDNIEDLDLVAFEEATSKGESTPMVCLDCGHKFKKKLGPKTYEVRCPKCRSFDTEIA